MIEDALMEWMEADAEVHKLKERIKSLGDELSLAEANAEQKKEAVAAIMAETGEYEVSIDGALTNYKIYYTTPRLSVKVDADAVPDEFCTIVRKPRLNDIKERFEGVEPLPNWVRFEKSEPKLAWKVSKK